MKPDSSKYVVLLRRLKRSKTQLVLKLVPSKRSE